MIQTITVNDVFDELRAENTRLADELSFANKCVHILLKFKRFLYDVYRNKGNTNGNPDESQFNELENEFNALSNERNTKISELLVENNAIINAIQTTRASKLSLEDKYRIINAIDNRGDKTKTEIAKQFNTSLTNLWFIFKDKQKLIRCYNESQRGENMKQLNNISVETINSCPQSKRRPALKRDVCAEDQSKSYQKSGVKRVKPKYAYKKRFKCDWIGCQFATAAHMELVYHKNRHLGLRPFKCTVSGCEKTFANKYEVTDHVRFVHQMKKTVSCVWPNCERMFKTSHIMAIHLRTHTTAQSERPFACDYPGCEYRALMRRTLIVHKLVHSDQKLHKCTFADCGKSFKSEPTMKAHLLTHNAEPPYRCDWPTCTAGYRSVENFRRHRRRHENVDIDVFRCDWPGCDYRSDRRNRVKRHRVTHTGERNYACSWPSCGKAYKSGANLREHLKIHRNDKRHKCQWPGCEYSCIQAANLKKHFNIHSKHLADNT